MSAAAPLKSLAAPLGRRTATLGHRTVLTTRGIRAGADRYTAIWAFFKQQHTTTGSSAARLSGGPRPLEWNAHSFHSTTRHASVWTPCIGVTGTQSRYYSKKSRRHGGGRSGIFRDLTQADEPPVSDEHYSKNSIYDASNIPVSANQPQGSSLQNTNGGEEATSATAPLPHDKDARNEPPPPQPPPHLSPSPSANPPLPPPSAAPIPPPPPPPAHNLSNYPRFIRRLVLSLPHLHRPTLDDFLNVSTGFWQRTRIRFKWFTIRSFRKFNADDMSAFVTWFLMSQTLWIFVGTTTFFSVVFATANSLRLQEYVARGISDYLTSETGVTIVFESAIVPKWKDSRISFKHVFISRRPPPSSSSSSHKRRKNNAHMAAVGYDVSNHPAYHHVGDDEDEHPSATSRASGEDGEDGNGEDEEDDNWSKFDLNVDSIDVTLSLRRWLDGKGLVEDAVVKGVRGVLDRRSIHWDPLHPLDPASFRHVARQGDFELASLQLEDVLITVYQPSPSPTSTSRSNSSAYRSANAREPRPFTASIFRADLRGLRKRWLFYDFLCAESVVGQFDGCLFSLHRPQSIGRTTEADLREGQWGRMTRIRIDGVNVDHMRGSTTAADDGPVSWITSGKVDAVLDIKFPRDPSEMEPLNVLLEGIADAITNTAYEFIPGQRELAKPPLSAPPYDESGAAAARKAGKEGKWEGEGAQEEKDDVPRVVVDIDLRFRDLKAAVPIFAQELSYRNNALIRPIVAFINANRTLVPIHCRVVKDLGDFDGAWTMWETGLMDEISAKIYDALAYHVTQANMNGRIRTVSLWSLQMTASAVLNALRAGVDPVSAHLREVYRGRGVLPA
ncbi:hypothetical protein PLICRDRAFT_36966 [Plicaturopsis crispa FD-325 SS-3]|nr:hypothetical protein PLICRDRAFT_36966 [Plicaturopsis crispa FD-325 SS-3]